MEASKNEEEGRAKKRAANGVARSAQNKSMMDDRERRKRSWFLSGGYDEKKTFKTRALSGPGKMKKRKKKGNRCQKREKKRRERKIGREEKRILRYSTT